jgi:hypothetical protein
MNPDLARLIEEFSPERVAARQAARRALRAGRPPQDLDRR